MTTDPTLEEIARLDDPLQYVCKRGVPIWVPHTRKLKDGQTVTVTEADLPKWADEINALYGKRGVAGRITDGHITPGKPRPKLVGYFRNARVGKFGVEQTPAVLVDCYYRVSDLDIAEERPYRSPEAYHDVKQIRGLALLLEDPWLDMGVVTYTADHPGIIRYALAENDMAGMGAMGPGNAEMPKEVGGVDAPDQVSPEEDAQYARAAKHIVRHIRSMYSLGEEWPGGAKPSDKADVSPEKAKEILKDGTANGHELTDKQEGMFGAIAGKEDHNKGGVTPMSTDKTPAMYAKELADANEKAAKATAELEQERCKTVLYSLQGEGFQFSQEQFDKEARKLAALPADQRDERKNELRAIYAAQQMPTGYGRVEIAPVSPDNQPDPDAFDKKVLVYMRAHPGMSPDQAADELRRQGQK